MLDTEIGSLGVEELKDVIGQSVQFSCSVMSDSVTSWTTERQASLSVTSSQSLLKLMSVELLMPSNHLILCCPLLLPPSIFLSIRSFPMSQFFTSGGQSIGVSPSPSFLPMNIQDWLPLGLTGWISLLSKDSQESSLTPQFKSINSSALSFLYNSTLTSMHDYWKNHRSDYTDLFGKVMSLLFNMLSRLVITFLWRSKCLLISWLQSPSAVILKPPKIKSVTVSTVSPSICHKVMGPDAMILSFLNVEF